MILSEQPAEGSALARALYPKQYDRTRETQVLEVIAVLLAHIRQLTVNPDVKPADMPSSYEDIFAKVEEAVEQIGFKGASLTLEEIDRLQGWDRGRRIDVEPDESG